MSPPVVPLSPPVAALVIVAGALWMTLAPQLPFAVRRRGLLTLLTWLGSRAGLVWLAHPDPASAAVALAADLLAWRALADAGGEGGEAAWAWVSTPAVALFTLGSPPAAAIGAAGVALALAAGRRSWALPAGLALGAGVAFGGPWPAWAVLPFVLAWARRPLRLAAVLVPVLAGLLLWRGHVHGPGWPPHLDPPVAGLGPTLWRVPAALGWTVPAVVGWGAAIAVAGWGAVRLGRAGAGPAAAGTWGFAALAAFAPGASGAHLLAWLPFVCAWSADDPDRRGWWVTEGLVLPLALLLESAALGGQAGPTWRWLALAGIPASALLALWPLRAMAARPVAPDAPAAAPER